MLDKLMKLFKVHFSTSLTLKDGTPLQLEGDLETGVQVSVVTSDGNIALPDGEYQMEDMTIITCKDGLVMDIIKPGEVEEPTDGLDPMGNDTKVDELVTQKGNPEVSGEDPQPMEDPLPTTTGTTTEDVAAAEMPVEPEPEVEVEIDPEELKIAELEAKISSLEGAIGEIMNKLNMISEKFSSATPLIKKKDNEGSSLINPKLQNKVDLINRLKKSQD